MTEKVGSQLGRRVECTRVSFEARMTMMLNSLKETRRPSHHRLPVVQQDQAHSTRSRDDNCREPDRAQHARKSDLERLRAAARRVGLASALRAAGRSRVALAGGARGPDCAGRRGDEADVGREAGAGRADDGRLRLDDVGERLVRRLDVCAAGETRQRGFADAQSRTADVQESSSDSPRHWAIVLTFRTPWLRMCGRT